MRTWEVAATMNVAHLNPFHHLLTRKEMKRIKTVIVERNLLLIMKVTENKNMYAYINNYMLPASCDTPPSSMSNTDSLTPNMRDSMGQRELTITSRAVNSERCDLAVSQN